MWPDGTVPQAGIERRAYRPRGTADPGLARAVVLTTYYADAEDARQARSRPRQVLCDVWLMRGGRLPGVPVLQHGSAVTNASLWVPQATTRNLVSGEPLTLTNAGEGAPPATSPEDLDGEQVLVGWIDGHADRPIVLGSLTHTRGAYPQNGAVAVAPPTVTPGEAAELPKGPDGNERWVAHQGTVARIDRNGNVRIDAAGAGIGNDGETDVRGEGETSGHVDLNLGAGAELVIRSGGVPVVRIKARPNGQVEVDLGVDPSERGVLGDRFAALFDGHRHLDALGTTGPVVVEDRIAERQEDPDRRVLSERVRLPAEST